jgi:16S rRNA pseudouridine516 synthase
LDKEVPEMAVELFKNGVDIGDDKLTLPAELVILSEKEAELTIHEGRFHQVKRMFEAVGCTVTYLKRLSMGSLVLGDLKIGEYRKLTEEEIIELQK